MNISPNSIAKRFMYGAVGNVSRLVVSTLTGFYIASELGAYEFGRYSFLVAICGATIKVIDLNVTSAYFTFFSSGKSDLKEEKYVILWYFFTYLTTLALLGFIDAIDRTGFLNNESILVLSFAFSALFLQQRIWVNIGHIFECLRLTKVYQRNFTVAVIFHSITLFTVGNTIGLTIETILYSIIIVWSLLIAYSYLIVIKFKTNPSNRPNKQSTKLEDYYRYCSPLLVYSVFVFLGEIFDRTMLTNIAGYKEQGYFSLAKQFSVISLVAVTSILTILWREIAELYRNGEFEEFKELLQCSTRVLYTFASLISCTVIPWSGEVVDIFFGNGYKGGVTVFAIMLLYPMHQVIGQISGSILLATEKTKVQTAVGVSSIILSMLVTYLIFLEDISILSNRPGALEIGLKMVLIQIFIVNVMIYVINKILNVVVIGFEQFLTPVFILLISYSIYGVVLYFDLSVNITTLPLYCLLCFSLSACVIFMKSNYFGFDSRLKRLIINSVK